MTWLVLERGISPRDASAVQQLAENAAITCGLRDEASFMHLDGIDPEPFLREDRVNENVSLVSSVPRVREILVDHLRRYAEKDDLVMEGRDIGSVVFPDTLYKFYIDASPEVRLQRRAAQGERDEIAIRDRADSLRLVSPLVIAKDAHVIDTSHLTIQQVIDKIIGLLKKMPPPI